MTHREFLLWLRPRLDAAAAKGLSKEDTRAIRDTLDGMQKAGTLQPFASRLFALVRGHATLDAATTADLASEVRSEIAPPRERTVVFSAKDDDET